MEWEEKNFVHLSIFDGRYENNALRSRVVLSYNKLKKQLDCRCGLNHCFCLHKAIALWYLFQTQRIGDDADVHNVFERRLRYVYKSKSVTYDVSLDGYAHRLIGSPQDNFTIDVVNVESVLKDSMSGIAAIFHALCLSREIDPTRVTFQYQQLRQKLVDIFDESSFESIAFESVPGRIRKVLFQWEVELYCHCREPFIEEPLIECISCKEWYHGRCETGNIDYEHWQCSNCKRAKRKRHNGPEEWREEKRHYSKEK